MKWRLFRRHFNCIFLNERFCMFITVSLKYVPNGATDNKLELVHVMTWHREGDKPLYESVMTIYVHLTAKGAYSLLGLNMLTTTKDCRLKWPFSATYTLKTGDLLKLQQFSCSHRDETPHISRSIMKTRRGTMPVVERFHNRRYTMDSAKKYLFDPNS